MLNGVTDLIITKADVLDGMPHTGICTGYKVNGELTDRIPFDINHASIEPQYEYIEQWDKALSSCSSDEDLPQSFKHFVDRVEKHTGVKISYVSNGVGRNQLIFRK
jgi:adenylosuccinate synthase